MRCTVKIRCRRLEKCSESSDNAEGESEPGAGTASRPAGLLTATTASSSYKTASSREKRRGGFADRLEEYLWRCFFTGASRCLWSLTVEAAINNVLALLSLVLRPNRHRLQFHSVAESSFRRHS
jgi:hypothetical protein